MINYDYYNICKVQKHLAGDPSLEVIKKWMETNQNKMELDDMGNIWSFKGESVREDSKINEGCYIAQWDNVIQISKRNSLGLFEKVVSVA